VARCSTKAWKAALARAGIEKTFRWHDLRHTWASWHVQNGTPLQELMELGSWASYEMVLATRIWRRITCKAPPVGSMLRFCYIRKARNKCGPRKVLNYMVAGDGIEPPTRGFSISSVVPINQ
jgi:hypothetical protein